MQEPLEKIWQILDRISKGRSNMRDLYILRSLAEEVIAELNQKHNIMEEIIEKYSAEDREKRLWDNVGFATDKGITWVDKYRMSDILNVTSEDYSKY